MIVASVVAMRMARRRGYWLVMLITFIALPLRGLIASSVITWWGVFPVQILDGIGAGLQSVAVPGLVARVLDGTGRVNVGQGAVMTVQGLGASLSPAFGAWAGAIPRLLGELRAARLPVAGLARPVAGVRADPEARVRHTSQHRPFRRPHGGRRMTLQPSAGHLAIWIIAALSTAGVIIRPFKWPEFIWACSGAVLLVLAGLLPISQAIQAVGKGADVYLFLLGMMLLSEIAPAGKACSTGSRRPRSTGRTAPPSGCSC